MIWNWKADHQNVTLPSGDVKIGSKDYTLATNSSPDAIASINQFPVNEVDGRIVLILCRACSPIDERNDILLALGMALTMLGGTLGD
jgi:hypothetical protein